MSKDFKNFKRIMEEIDKKKLIEKIMITLEKCTPGGWGEGVTRPNIFSAQPPRLYRK